MGSLGANLQNFATLKLTVWDLKPSRAIPDVRFKRQLGARLKADRNTEVGGRSESHSPTSDEAGRYERLSNFGRARRDSMKAVITHGIPPLKDRISRSGWTGAYLSISMLNAGSERLVPSGGH